MYACKAEVTHMRIILASQSPRRRQLLGQIGVEYFEILVPEADESYDPALPPEEIVASICRKRPRPPVPWRTTPAR